MPTVSIIIPAYNQARYLGESIQSALDQTYPDMEIIVINDGSTDETAEIVQQYHDPRIRYFYQENRGLSAARNSGLRLATGEYISFLDADDCFLPEKLAWEVAEMENQPQAGFIAGQAILINQDSSRLGLMSSATLPEEPDQMLLGNPLHVGSVLVRRAWIDRVGLFDERLRACEDWDMWLRLSLAGCVTKGLSKPVSLYRVHPAQMTQGAERMRKAMLAVLGKVFSQPGLPPRWMARQNEAYAAAYVRSAARAFHANLLSIARHDLWMSVRRDPSLLEGSGSKLADLLTGWASAPMVDDQLAYLERVYQNLPDELACLRGKRQVHLSDLALDIAYRHMQRNEVTQARRFLLRSIRYQPERLSNKGILAMLMRSFLPLNATRV